MTGRAYAQSAQGRRGDRPVRALRGEPRGAQQRHADAPRRVVRDPGLDACADTALLDGRARARGTRRSSSASVYGYRNAQATVLAPTGTISFLMDCDTTGIEPDFSLVKFKELVGGGQMTIVNRTVPLALQTLGYADEQIEQIEAHINEHGTIVGAPGLADEHLPVFDVAVGERAISHMGHIKMMGAVQPFISGAISKTVNMPQTATVEDIADAYIEAWRLGVKALAIYRDGSKTAQALRTDAQEGKPSRRGAEGALHAGAGRRARPRGRASQAAREAGPSAQADAARAPVDHAQVLDRRPRGLHHRRHVRGRHGRRDLPHRHRQGGLDAPRHDELVRDGDLDRAAVRRAARDARAEVQLHALRAGGDHRRTRRSRSPSRCPTTSCAGSPRASSTPTPRRSSGSSPPEVRARKDGAGRRDCRSRRTPPAPATARTGGNGGTATAPRRRRRRRAAPQRRR